MAAFTTGSFTPSGVAVVSAKFRTLKTYLSVTTPLAAISPEAGVAVTVAPAATGAAGVTVPLEVLPSTYCVPAGITSVTLTALAMLVAEVLLTVMVYSRKSPTLGVVPVPTVLVVLEV